ncbi:MBL fold metallo-hydrolase [Modestobacter sp. SYSU DS0875]
MEYTRPEADQVEVSIFGPGYGEALAIHLGNDKWLLVDSCSSSRGTTPAALSYLTRLGYEPAECVQAVVVSHWHDDHVRGLSQILQACPSAGVFASRSVGIPEFQALMDLPPVPSKFTSGVQELSGAQRVLRARGDHIKLIGATQRIYNVPSAVVSEVWSLSPSAEDDDIGRQHLAGMLASVAGKARRLPALDPNDTTVVLLLLTSAGSVLLGGDLEHRPSSRTRGWHAIVDDTNRPPIDFNLFKIPHHGSEGAHCDEVWDHLAGSRPISVISPYQNGSVTIPTAKDKARIKRHSAEAWVTSERRAPAPRRDRTSLRTIETSTRYFSEQPLVPGHVRWRSGSMPQITADGAASKL